MKNKPLVSVVIPVYNSETYIEETLSSVMETDYDNYEVIVVDDGSTDKSGVICDLFAKDKDLVKVFHTVNMGVSHARNLGIQEARGEYILPLDSDDKIHGTYIRKAVERIKENEKIGMVYCRAEFFGNKSGAWNLPKFSLKRMLEENIIFNCALFRKQDWLVVGGYDESLVYGSEDYDFWLSIIGLGKTAVCIPEVLFFYRRRANSRTDKFGKLDFKQILDVKRTIMLKHRDMYAANVDVLLEMYLLQEKKYSKERRRRRKYGAFLKKLFMLRRSIKEFIGK